MINGYGVSVLQEEERSGDGWWHSRVNVLMPAAHLEMVKTLNFTLCTFHCKREKWGFGARDWRHRGALF